jgi:putative heme-binding domain-containing protein
VDVLPVAAKLARDEDPGVRREVAVSLRDVPAEKSLDLLVELARGYDGQDRTYLEALGTGATKKEAALYERLRQEPGAKADPLAWDARFARLAWRLHVPAAVPDLLARARSSKLSATDRRLAMDTLAFIEDPAASRAMLTLAEPDSALKEPATWWLLNRMTSSWTSHNLRPVLKTAGIYDPDAIVLREATIPKPDANVPELSLQRIAALQGDAARGKETVARCQICHQVAGVGAELGPALDGWGRGKSAEVIATAIVRPDAEIAHGYDGWELRTNEGLTIQGVLIKQGDPLMMRSMGGVTQIVPLDRVGSRRRVQGSLMMSAAQLQLTEQDVADLVAFLSRNGGE